MTFVNDVVLSISLANVQLKLLDRENMSVIIKGMREHLISFLYSYPTYTLIKIIIEHLTAWTITKFK